MATAETVSVQSYEYYFKPLLESIVRVEKSGGLDENESEVFDFMKEFLPGVPSSVPESQAFQFKIDLSKVLNNNTDTTSAQVVYEMSLNVLQVLRMHFSPESSMGI